jgi:hypothetical protein
MDQPRSSQRFEAKLRTDAVPNDVSCWDFLFDRPVNGGQLKWLAVAACAAYVSANASGPAAHAGSLGQPCS